MSMSVSEALKALDELVEAGGIKHYERAIAVLRAHIERELTVSDVDKAVIVFYGSKHLGSSDYGAMKAALIAALEVGK